MGIIDEEGRKTQIKFLIVFATCLGKFSRKGNTFRKPDNVAGVRRNEKFGIY